MRERFFFNPLKYITVKMLFAPTCIYPTKAPPRVGYLIFFNGNLCADNAGGTTDPKLLCSRVRSVAYRDHRDSAPGLTKDE